MTKILQYFQEKVVFLPVTLPQDHRFDFENNFEEYLWETPDGGLISSIHFKIPNPKGIIVYFHGNADNLDRWGKITQNFTQYGYDVLVMDYRGFGKSTGERNEKFLYADAQFAYDFARRNYGEDQTLVYGRSLGGTFAVKTAADNQPQKVILESAFYNLQDIVNRWLPGKVTDKVSPKMTYHFHSDRYIRKIGSPLYHFHGSKDLVVPLRSGKKLFEIFEQNQPLIPKKFIEITGAGHDNLATFEKFSQEMKTILE
ncbi:alpha/beta hydrolase [Chryseobacterium sp. MFBS3-17]|uniref:alpha/beta hydrolase n=1 Tax=Chryseobacterium sp. MFBS3-17 TaxID=2886689 RepID=UPI001D0E733F|nr:alpha/beta fold hydrolase [Chryseobacterium sp. MFBS3-17]MCC2590288.1 alpha/beta hydrolase [Chryseobacterium sp. MFBS3-17]